MHKLLLSTALALMAVATTSGAVMAQATASAVTDLNIRSGPGPDYPTIGHIPAGGSVAVSGCLEASKWCEIDFEGTIGWSYSDYLTADLSGQPVILTERRADVGVPAVEFSGAATGAAGGAVVGALVGGPIGAAVGGIAGALGGATADAVIDPPEQARLYVEQNRLDPIYLEGEVVVGAVVPEPVELREIPEYNYRYVVINGQPVLIDPATRQIVYIFR